jgi:hypothetical protein
MTRSRPRAGDEFWRDIEKRLDELEKKKGNERKPAPSP